MTDQQDDWAEERQALIQRLYEEKERVRLMVLNRSEAGLNALALRCAHFIEDEFVFHQPGGVVQRRAKIQIIVREAIRETLIGDHPWDTWKPGNGSFAPSEPIVGDKVR